MLYVPPLLEMLGRFESDFPGELLESISIQIRCSLMAEQLNNIALCRKSGWYVFLWDVSLRNYV